MKNVSKLKNAILYADAMYEGAEQAGQLDRVYDDACRLKSVLGEHEAEISKLNNPLWNNEDKIAVLKILAEKIGLHQVMFNTLQLLAQNRKLNLLLSIMDQFILRYQQRHNIAQIDVLTVVPLTDRQDLLLKEKLKKIFQKEVILNYVIDPQIIGGLVIKYGTNFIDNSIKHKLCALEQLMKGAK